MRRREQLWLGKCNARLTPPPSCEVYRVKRCANGELPSDPQQTAPVRRRKLRQKTPVAVHHRSACSGVKALRNTSAAKRQAAKPSLAFRSLTPSARSANLIAGDGTKNGLSAPNKEPGTNQNDYLTGKAPYKSGELRYAAGVGTQGSDASDLTSLPWVRCAVPAGACRRLAASARNAGVQPR